MHRMLKEHCGRKPLLRSRQRRQVASARDEGGESLSEVCGSSRWEWCFSVSSNRCAVLKHIYVGRLHKSILE